MDPYLVLEGDIRLRAGCSGFPQEEEVVAYGSDKDDSAALNSSEIVENDSRLKEIVITHFTSKFQTLSEVLIQFKIITLCIIDQEKNMVYPFMMVLLFLMEVVFHYKETISLHIVFSNEDIVLMVCVWSV